MKHNQSIKIAIVEDDEFFAGMMKAKLQKQKNFDIDVFHKGVDFLRALSEQPEIVVIDYSLPDKNGLEILKEIKVFNKEIPCIVLSGQKELEVVVEAYKLGAERYIIKDENAIIELDQYLAIICKTIELRKELEVLKNQIIDTHKYQNIIGESSVIKKMFKLMQKVENIKINWIGGKTTHIYKLKSNKVHLIDGHGKIEKLY